MKVFQKVLKEEQFEELNNYKDCDLVFLFGDIEKFYNKKDENLFKNNKKLNVIGCTTEGFIHDNQFIESSVSLSALKFEKSSSHVLSSEIIDKNLKNTAVTLAKKLPKENLKSVITFCVGHYMNGSELLEGLKSVLDSEILITGGLAGGEANFESTMVSHNETISDNLVVIIGLYGEHINVSSGCEGGWKAFGPKRLITKSKDNMLYELDGVPALDIYKNYLGEKSKDLPASALLFPLSLKINGENLTRAVLNVDEENGTMLIAGDIPQDEEVQFMISNHHELIDGAEKASEDAFDSHDIINEGLLLMVSCIGRKLVLDNYLEDEIEAVSDIFDERWKNCGFYSYGELAPYKNKECFLHNQTMTITTISEKP